jgi:transketolase
VASGLVNAGFRPFVYTISNFLIHRALEQIRNDILLHEYPVVLVGTSAGYDNAPLGPTHHIIDDWGPLAALAGRMEIYCPCSKSYASGLVERLVAEGRPGYVRIPKAAAMEESPPGDWFHVEGPPGSTLYAGYGTTAPLALKAGEALILQKLSPLNKLDLIRQYRRVVVIEDHVAHSGLYAALCRMAVENGWGVQIESAAPKGYLLTVSQCGIDLSPVGGIGGQNPAPSAPR